MTTTQLPSENPNWHIQQQGFISRSLAIDISPCDESFVISFAPRAGDAFRIYFDVAGRITSIRHNHAPTPMAATAVVGDHAGDLGS